MFDDIFADVISNRKLQPVVSSFLLRERLNIFYGFHHIVMPPATKACKTKLYSELQQITITHLSDTDLMILGGSTVTDLQRHYFFVIYSFVFS